MNYAQLVVGFDAREMTQDFRTTWPQYQQETYLLRQEIIKPLSVDDFIWSSIFRSESETRTGGIDLEGSKISEIPIEYRNYENLWGNPEVMQRFLEHVKGHYWIIAVAELMGDADKERLKSAYLRFGSAEVDPKWILLGFDIAQENLTSGLMNTSYSPDEIDTAKARWVPYLNEYHLFTDEEQADLFADWADERDPGKAPYFVYALYRIEAR